MTEKDIEKLDAEVFSTLSDPDVELEWIDARIIEFRRLEQDLIAGYRLNKYLRQDDRMDAIRKDLGKVRSSLEYLPLRAEELRKAK